MKITLTKQLLDYLKSRGYEYLILHAAVEDTAQSVKKFLFTPVRKPEDLKKLYIGCVACFSISEAIFNSAMHITGKKLLICLPVEEVLEFKSTLLSMLFEKKQRKLAELN